MVYFEHISCGKSIPAENPHAVSVNIPTIGEVVDYEEGKKELLDKLESGYPRFQMNRLVKRVCDDLRVFKSIPATELIFPLSSSTAAEKIEKALGVKFDSLSFGGIGFIILNANSDLVKVVKHFLQHTGMIPSSRKAEDYLLSRGLISTKFQENAITESPSAKIKELLAENYVCSPDKDVFLATCAMNSIYSVFEVLKSVQSKKNRNIIVQYGWLYIDTMEIIKKFSSSSHISLNLTNPEELEKYLETNGECVAALFTEVPTNPLVQTIDLPHLSDICKRYDIPLIIDSTIATAFNIDVLKYSDVVIESLTKYACGKADVMMGSVMLNNQSKYYNELLRNLPGLIEEPYLRDVERLAYNIEGYENRVKLISKNTRLFVEFLGKSPNVKKIHWAESEDTHENYNKIRKNDLVPGLISVVFDKDLSHYYDRLRGAKGPSFGTEFTLSMPYVYMAHYDLIKTQSGREYLIELGIHPELLRISVGIEPIDEIITAFGEVLV